MAFQLKSLLTFKKPIDVLSVMSYEMDIYLVQIQIGDEVGMLYDGDSPKRFGSKQAIRDIFDDVAVKHAEMIHNSPYDEMIGNPPKVGTTVLPFSMKTVLNP